MVRQPAKWITAVTIFVAALTFYLAGVSPVLDNLLLDWRFRVLTRPASGSIVIVQIDSRSLRELDTWPWSREYHAEVLDRLLQAGASEVALDIDFSSRSSEGADRALAAALARAASRSILPTFRQAASPEVLGDTVFNTIPRLAFSEHAQIGSTNVTPARDGLIRSVSTVQVIGDKRQPAMFALLAGPSARFGQTFNIDFAIDATTIPRLSYVDVLRGDFAADSVAGKKVIVGATAAELGDMLPVPVFRSISGPSLQALAYESVIQGRALKNGGLIGMVSGSIVLLLVFMFMFENRSWRSGLVAGVVGMFALEAGATVLQSITPVALQTGPWIVTIFLCMVVTFTRRFEGQAREILAQRLAIVTRQALLDRMVQDSFDGIMIADASYRVAVSNEAAGRILDFPAEDAVGQPIERFLPGTSQFAAKLDDTATDAHRSDYIGPHEWQFPRSDGKTALIELVVGQVHLDLSKRGRRDRESRQTFYTFTFRDISERKRVEEAERRALENALTANRAKTEFLANISHELRTPLNAVIGFSEMIRDESLGPGHAEYRTYAGHIHKSGRHLLEVINDILDLSRIEAGRDKLIEEATDIAEIVTAAGRVAQARHAENNVTLAYEVQGDAPLVLADGRKLKQILVNLLTNAIKFSRPGSTVTVRSWCEPNVGHFLQVVDRGIGMAPDDIPKALSIFEQVDGGLDRKYDGTGLGLPLTKVLVDLHGGTMEVDSELGVGTSVTVQLPASRLILSPTASDIEPLVAYAK